MNKKFLRHQKGITWVHGIIIVVVIAIVAAGVWLAIRKPPAPPSKELKVGVILPGTVTDYGWDYAPLIALNKLEADIPEVIVGHKFVELVEPAEAEGAIRDLMAAGYNWIWAWGFQYREAVAAAAVGAPEGTYFTINEGRPADAVSGKIDVIDEWPNKTAYLAGIVAASMSKTKKLGSVFGMETWHLVAAEVGFEAGAQAYDPAMTVDRVVVGGWADPEGGRHAAEALMAGGVDVILCQGDGTSLGVIEAVKSARTAGREVYYVGYPVDQSILAPGDVLTSLSYDYSGILKDQAQDIQTGNFGKGNYVIELGKGMELAPYYNFDEYVPSRAKTMIADARAKIIAGEIVVPHE